MCEKINAFDEKNLSLSGSIEVGTFGYLKLLDFKEKKKALNMRKKGEAEIEKGPVDLFPAEPTEQVLRTCENLNDAKHCLRSRRIIKEV